MAEKSDWTARHKVIYRTLSLCAVMIVTIIGVGCWNAISGKAVDANTASLLSTGLYALSGLAGSIIGSFCFSAAWQFRAKDPA